MSSVKMLVKRQDVLNEGWVADAAQRDWLSREIPFFECPERAFEELWYYRWDLVRRHLRYVSDAVGYIITEFNCDDPLYWAGAFNSIVCASDHHVNEARWLHSSRYVQDYLRFLLTHPEAQPQAYSSALAASVWSVLQARGDTAFACDMLDPLIANHERWLRSDQEYPHDRGFDARRGLFWNTGRDSSGEFNLASAQLNECLRGIQGYKIRGGAGYRPDINADMFADMLALSRIAHLAGRQDESRHFADSAARLKSNVMRQLWDPRRTFFMHRWLRDEYSEADRHGKPTICAGSLIWETNGDRFGGVGFQPNEKGEGRGRELVGYTPWYRGIVDDTIQHAGAWKFLMDRDYFYAPFGPTTAERHDPWFLVQCDCRANGNSFPLVTSRVLQGVANVLHEHRHHGPLTADAYMNLLRIYVRTQSRDGKPYLAEFHHPDADRWVVDRPIGEHYFHSSFCDLVITGLIGLRPRPDRVLEVNPLVGEAWDYFALEDLPYHGQRLSIVYDRDGRRYGREVGLSVYVNGKLLVTAPRLQSLTAALPPIRVSGSPASAPSVEERA